MWKCFILTLHNYIFKTGGIYTVNVIKIPLALTDQLPKQKPYKGKAWKGQTLVNSWIKYIWSNKCIN